MTWGSDLSIKPESDIKSEVPLYKFYVIDIDGTLVDMRMEYLEFLFGKIREELPKAKFPVNKKEFNELTKHIWYEQDREKIIREKLGIKSREFWDVFRKYDTKDMRRNNLVIYNDISVLSELKANGAKIAVLSDSPKEITELEAKIVEGAVGKNFEFDYKLSVGYNSNHNSKPHIEGLEECIKTLGAVDSKVLYVGNSPEADILQAHNYNDYMSRINQRNFELARAVSNSFSTDASIAAVSFQYKPVDSALILRKNAHYTMKSVYKRDIYTKEELRPNFIIRLLYDLTAVLYNQAQ